MHGKNNFYVVQAIEERLNNTIKRENVHKKKEISLLRDICLHLDCSSVVETYAGV
jgi:hypothetical protein